MLSIESPQHPNVVSLSFALAYLCQIPPAAILHYPALSSPSPVFSPDPSLFPARSLLFTQSPCVPGCLLPCPLPRGHLYPHFSRSLSPHPFLHHPMDLEATQEFSSSQLMFLLLSWLSVPGISNYKENPIEFLYPYKAFSRNHQQVCRCFPAYCILPCSLYPLR